MNPASPRRRAAAGAASALAVALVGWVVAVGTAGVGIAGVGAREGALAGDHGAGVPVVDAADRTAIEALLAERSAAVLAGDVGARLATLHPAADPRLVNIEGRTATSGAAVGLAHYRETLWEPAVDLTPPGGDRRDGRRAITLEVRRELRIADFDDRDHVSSLFLTFVDTDDGWRIAADDDLASIGLAGDRELWELFDTSIERRPRVLVIGTAGAARHRALADLTERALTRFDAVWREPWTGSVVMIVPARVAEIEALLQPTIDVSKFVAFTTLAVDRRDGWSVVAPRIVAQEGNLALRSADAQTEILVHELVHVASVVRSGPATPLWAHEGLAEWVTAGRPTRDGGELVLPDLHRFRTGSSADIREVYDQAADTMAQLAGAYGDGAPVALFDQVGEAVRVPGTTDHVLDVVLRDITGSSLAELTR